MWRKILSIISIVLLIIGQIMPYGGGSLAYAENETFTQTDWSGGQSDQIAVHPTNKTGWTKYKEKDDYLDTSSAGKITLSAETKSITDTTDTDFGKGTRDKLDISNGSLVLQSAVTDPFVTNVGQWTSLPEAPTLGIQSAFVRAGGYIYALWDRKTFGKFSIADEKWTFLAETPQPISYGAALAYPGSGGDFIYATRGSGTKDFWKYSISGDSWTELDDATYNVGTGGSLAAPGDGYVYCLVGGESRRFLRYSISGNNWSALSDIINRDVSRGGGLVYPGTGDYLYASYDWWSTNFSRYKFQGTGAGGWETCTGVSYPSNLCYPGTGDYLYAWSIYGNNFARFSFTSQPQTWQYFADIPLGYGRDGIAYYPGSGTKIKVLTAGNYTQPMSFDTQTLKWDEPAGLDLRLYGGSRMCYDGSNYIYVDQGYNNTSYRGWSRYSISDNIWESRAVLPVPFEYGSDFTYYGGYIYGLRGVNTADFYRYDTSAAGNTWQSLAAAPGNVSHGGSIVTAGSYLYAFQGNSTNKFWRYTYNTWDDAAVADAPDTVYDGGALCYPGTGDYIYASRGGVTKTFWKYSILGNSWSACSDAPFRFAKKATLMFPGSGDYIYVMPGHAVNQHFLRYKFQGTGADTWEVLESTPYYQAYSYAACAVGDNIYSMYSADYDLYKYTISTGKWGTKVDANGFTPYYGSIVYVGGNAYMFYGFNSCHIWKFNVAQKKWVGIIRAPFLLGRGTKACYPGSGNFIYVIEGRNSNHLWQYDYGNDSWTQLEDAPVAFNRNSQLDGNGDLLFACQGTEPATLPSGNYDEMSYKFLKYTISAHTWETKADLPTYIYDFIDSYYNFDSISNSNLLVYIPAQGKVYWKADYGRAQLYSYDVIGNSWSTLTDAPAGSSRGSCFYYPGAGNDIYLRAGSGFYKYTIGSGWTTLKTGVPGFLYGDGDMFYPGSGDFLYIWSAYKPFFTRYSISNDDWDLPYRIIWPDYYGYNAGVFCRGADGDSFFVGTGRGDSANAFYKYTISTRTWDGLATTYSAADIGWSWQSYDPALIYDGGNCLYSTRAYNYSDFVRYYISGNYWQKLASPPSVFNQGHKLVAAGGKIYALKGGFTSTFWCYDPATNTWSTKTNVPQIVRYGSSLLYPGSGDYIYVTTGNNTPYFYKYKFQGTGADTWTQLTDVPASLGGVDDYIGRGGYGYGGTSMAYPGRGDYIYLVQGTTYYAYDGSSSVFRYSISNNTWEDVDALPVSFNEAGELIYPGAGNYLYAWEGNNSYYGCDIFKFLVFKDGSYTSEVKEIGKNKDYDIATWDNAVNKGFFEFKARSSDNSAMSGATAWAGISALAKGGDLSTLSSVTDGHKYLQYQMKFYADDLTKLPQLNSLTLNYSRYPTDQKLYSNVYNSTEARNRLMKLSWTETTPSGTDVKLQLKTSPDNVTWSSWLGPFGTTSTAYDFSSAGDYAMSSLIKLDSGNARLVKDLEDFQYKQAVIIDNTGLGATTNVIVTLDIDSKNNAFWPHVRSDGADIRFYDGSQKLSYYLPTFDYTNKIARINIKIPSLSAGQVKTIYMLYGSSGAVSESNNTVADIPLNGLTGRWTFNEGAGSAKDSSVYGNNGTISGATYTSSGKIGGAYTFDGTDDYIRCFGVQNPGAEWTIAAWVKLNTTASGSRAIAARAADGETEDANFNQRLYMSGGQPRIFYEYGAGSDVERYGGTNLSTGTWYHLVGVRDKADADKLIMYINGSKYIGSYNGDLTQDPTGSTNAGFAIGRDGSSSSAYFNGTIDEVLLYNRPLAAAEITQVYNYTGSYSGSVYIAVPEVQTTSPTLGANWPYREEVILTNSTSSALSDYAVQVDVNNTHSNFWTHVQNDADDIRFIDSDNTTALDYKLVSFDYTAKTASLLVKVPSISASSSKTIYMYYGNGSATAGSNPAVLGEYVPSSGLVGWWKFDESSGTTTADSSTGGNSGTIYGATYTTGKYANALSFNGTDNFVSMMDSLNNVGSPLTLNAWVYWSGGQSSPIVVSDDSVSSYYAGFWLTINSNGTLDLAMGCNCRNDAYGVRTKTTTGTVTPNTWTHISAIIISTSDMRVYINGTDAGGTYTTSGSYVSIPVHTIDAFVIGRRQYGTDTYFKGKIDSVSIYNRELSSSEITKLAQDNMGDYNMVSLNYNETANTYSIAGTYPTSNPVIQPILGALYNNDLGEFQETAPAVSGTAIKYQVSKDGYNWYWWNGTTSTWEVVPGGYNYANTAAVINDHLKTDPNSFLSVVGTSGEFYYRAYLHSDTGTQTPLLDKITVTTASPTTYYLDKTGATAINQTHTDAVSDQYYQYMVKLYSAGGATPILDDISLEYIKAYLTLTSPVGAEVWAIGAQKNITWNTGGLTDVGGVFDETIKIDYTTNGTDWTTVAANAPNTGNYQWTVPNTHTASAKVKITANGWSQITSQSTSNFRIVGTVNLTAPDGAERWVAGSKHNITWISSGISQIPQVKLEYSINNGTAWRDMAGVVGQSTTVSNTGSYEWTIPNTITTTDSCLVRISDTVDADTKDQSSAGFRIIGAFSVTYPTLNLALTSWANYNVTWTTTGTIPQVNLTYSVNGTSGPWMDMAGNVGQVTTITNTSPYSWTVPNPLSDTCILRVTDKNDSTVYADSPNFYIRGFQVATPNGNEQWELGSTHTITWSSGGTIDLPLKIYLSTDGTTYPYWLKQMNTNPGFWDWEISGLDKEGIAYSTSNTCKIKIVDNSNRADVSDVNFKIMPTPAISVTAPTSADEWIIGTGSHNITWTTTGNISSDLAIEYAVNGGTWTAVSPAPTSQQITNKSYAWAIPDVGGALPADTQIRVRETTVPAGRDTPSLKSAASQTFKVTTPTLTMTAPTTGTIWAVGDTSRTITWTSVGTLIDNLKLDYSVDGGTDWTNITTFTQAQQNGTYNWTDIPSGAAGDSVLMRISDSRTPANVSDNSDAIKILAHEKVTLTHPSTGEILIQGDSYIITWNWDGQKSNSNLTIRFSTDNGVTWLDVSPYVVETEIPNSPAAFLWTVPNSIESEQVIMRIYDPADETEISSYSGAFTITIPKVPITAPAAGANWFATGAYNITWNTIGSVSSDLKLEYQLDNGSWVEIPLNAQEIAAKSKAWSVPDNAGSTCKIRITDNTRPAVTFTTEAFNIIAPTVTITAPTGSETGPNAWVVGTDHNITWTATGVSSSAISGFRVQYSTTGPSGAFTTCKDKDENLASNLAAGTTSFAWRIPDFVSSNVCIKIFDPDRTATTNTSNVFEIKAPSLTITSPNLGTESWIIGTQHDITWYSVGGVTTPLKLFYTPDGSTWKEITLASGGFDGVNDGSFTWTIPNDYSAGLAKVKIEDSYTPTARSDVSDKSFTIALPTITVVTPSGLWSATDTKAITWSSVGTLIGPLKVEWSLDNFADPEQTHTISEEVDKAATSLNWIIPDAAKGTTVRTRVTDLGRPLVRGKSSAFTILPVPEITISAPTSADTGANAWRIGKQYTITWSDNGGAISNSLKLQYSENAGDDIPTWTDIAPGEVNDGSYLWRVPTSASASTDCKIRIYDNVPWKTGTNLSVDSPTFEIAIPRITVISPAGGVYWAVGESPTITWTSDGFINDDLALQYTTDGTNYLPIASGELNDGSYTWAVPQDASASSVARVKILDASSDYGGQQVVATSNTFNIIAKPAITVTAPNGGQTYVLGDSVPITWTSRGVSVANVKIEYSANNFQTARTIEESTPNDGSYTWLIPNDALSGSTIKIRISMVGDPTVYDISDANFRIRGGFTVTAPTSGQRFIVHKAETFTWTTKGTIDNVKLKYTSDSTANPVVWTTITNSTTNNNSYTYTIPEPKSTTARVRIEDATDDTVYAESANFTTDYYAITWRVLDYDTNAPLQQLKVRDTFWVDQTGTITSPIEYGYPYGAYTTFWTKDGYIERSQEWTADNDKTVTVPLENQITAMVEWHVLVSTSYNADTGAGTDMLKVSTWLERRGKLVGVVATDLEGLQSAAIEVSDGTSVIKSMSTTTHDNTGVYWFSWDSTGLEAGKTYFIKSTIGYRDSTYTSGGSVDVTDAKKILETKTLIEAEALKTTAIQTAVQVTLPGKVDAARKSIEDKVDAAKSSLDTKIDTKVGEVKAETAKILTAAETTLPAKVEEARQEVETTRKSEILNRENAIRAGQTMTVRYRTYSGLSPTIDVYNAENTQCITKGKMTEIGTTGIYEYDVEFSLNWDRGDFTIICSESTKGTLDALIVTVLRTDLEQVYSQVSAVLGSTSGISDLKQVAISMNSQFSIIETALSKVGKDLLKDVKEAAGSAAALESVFSQVASLAKQVKQITGETGMNLEKLYQVSADKKRDILYLKNKTQELKAAVEMTKQMADNIANKPITQTWYEYKK